MKLVGLQKVMVGMNSLWGIGPMKPWGIVLAA